MKQLLFLLASILLCLPLSAQDLPQRKNQLDAQNKKQGDWILLFDKDWNPTNAPENAAFYRLLSYQDNKPLGPVVDYYRDGRKQMVAESLISEDPELMQGLTVYYDKEGQVEDYEYYEQGSLDKDKTIEYRKKLLGEIESRENGKFNLSYFSTLYNGIYKLYESQGAYLPALETLTSSGEVLAQIRGEASFDYANLLAQRGQMQRFLGQLDEASSSFKKALKIINAKQGKKSLPFGIFLNELANVFLAKGDYARSEGLFRTCLGILEEVVGPNHRNYAIVQSDLARFYSRTGNYKESERYYREAIAVYEANPKNPRQEYSTLLNNLANLLQDQKKLVEAEKYYQKALEINKEVLGTQHPNYASQLGNVAKLYLARDQYERAEKFFIESSEIFEKRLGKKHLNYAKSLRKLGELYSILDQSAKAQGYFSQAQSILKENLGEKHPLYIELLQSMAQAGMRDRNFERSEGIYREINQGLFEQIKNYFPAMSEGEKEYFYNNKVRLHFEEFNTFAALRYPESSDILGDMYNNQLATKALLLNASNKWKQRIKKSGDMKLIRALDDWQTQKAYLSRLYQEEDKANKAEIDSIERYVNQLEKELSLRSEYFAKVQDKKTYTWQDVQATLQKDEAVVEIIRFRKFGVPDTYKAKKIQRLEFSDEIYYAALIITEKTKDHPQIVLMTNGNDMEGKFLKNYSNQVKIGKGDKYSYGTYWEPIAQELRGVKKVYFSPDGIYNKINLNTIYSPSKDDYLIDEIEIQLLTSSKDLLIQHESDQFNKFALLFGAPNYNLESEERGKVATRMAERNSSVERGVLDEEPVESTYALNTASVERSVTLNYLPGTKIEVEAIGEILKKGGWETTIYTNDEALEENLKNTYKPGILHIATHGFFDASQTLNEGAADNPLLHSGLMFTGAGHSLQDEEEEEDDLDDLLNDESSLLDAPKRLEDGILTAYEAMNLNLDNEDMVVLSACETGLGEIKNGEGVYGLQRAFKVAGVRTIVMSLWNVNDDTTQQLMRSFYLKYIEDGMGKHQSFILAQKDIRAKYPAPYYWGAFVMVGE